jgi:hypothetical protein
MGITKQAGGENPNFFCNSTYFRKVYEMAIHTVQTLKDTIEKHTSNTCMSPTDQHYTYQTPAGSWTALQISHSNPISVTRSSSKLIHYKLISSLIKSACANIALFTPQENLCALQN